MSEVPPIEEALEMLRRLYRTGRLDNMVVVYIGPDDGAAWLFASDIDREGDAIRLSGGIATVQHIVSSANMVTAQAPEPLGPQGAT